MGTYEKINFTDFKESSLKSQCLGDNSNALLLFATRSEIILTVRYFFRFQPRASFAIANISPASVILCVCVVKRTRSFIYMIINDVSIYYTINNKSNRSQFLLLF